MTKITYNIAQREKSGGYGAGSWKLVPITGELAFEMYGLQFGVHKEGHGVWIVSELSTGFKAMQESWNGTRKKAIEDAKKTLENAGEIETALAVKRCMELIRANN